MNKAFWSHFKHFGRLLGKTLSVPHSQQVWWKSFQPARCTYNLQPDLLGSFPVDVCSDITGQFGCGLRAKYTPSVGEEGGRGEKKLFGIACTYTSCSLKKRGITLHDILHDLVVWLRTHLDYFSFLSVAGLQFVFSIEMSMVRADAIPVQFLSTF